MPRLKAPKRLSPQERMFRAKIAVMENSPFFGYLLSRLVIVEDPTCDTMWTNSVEIGWSPAYVDSISDLEILGVLIHEILHIVGGHCWRMGMRNPELWNEAADRAIYWIILSAGYVLPEGALDDTGYRGMPAEVIYEKLMQKLGASPPKPKSSKGDKGKGGEKQQGGGAGDEQDADENEGAEAGAGGSEGSEGKEDAEAGADSQAAGDPAHAGKSAAGGKAGDGQLPGQKRKVAGEVRPAPEGVDKKVIEQEWKMAVGQAEKFASMYGSMPGNLKSFIDAAMQPKVDWKEVLWDFVQQSTSSADYSWAKPSRCYMAAGMYAPSLIGQDMPPMVVAEDTSASVYDALLKQFRTELKAIGEQLRPEKIYHLQTDKRIAKVTELDPGDDFPTAVYGRGGTDFREPFKWVDKEGHTPTCFIYMSDMDGPYPEVEPPYPVLWLCPPGCRNPPWGTKLEMSFDQYN